jgi:hypothetical protein
MSSGFHEVMENIVDFMGQWNEMRISCGNGKHYGFHEVMESTVDFMR